jgi:hypothetical protein
MVAATHFSAAPNTAQSSAAAPERSAAASPLFRPPTERDWYLYEAVQIEGLSSRQAAQRFGISQTRVQQIRRQMTEWLAVIAGPEAGLSPTERICAAIDLAERRCNFLYSEAMEAWRASQEPQVSTRIGPGGHELKTTTLKGGDSRYLWMAMRMNTQMLHILGLGKKLLADNPEWTFDSRDPKPVSESQVTGKRARKRPADADSNGESSIPPVGDCSPQGGEQGAPAREAAESANVSPMETTRSEIREARRQAIIAAYNREIETVQQAEEADRERAREIVAAFNKAEEELERAAAQQAGEDDEEDEVDLDHDEPEEGQFDDLTDAEKAAERHAVQVLRQMDPIEAYQTLLACSRSDATPALPTAASQQPLNRKERRARQKLLARKLRKAK